MLIAFIFEVVICGVLFILDAIFLALSFLNKKKQNMRLTPIVVSRRAVLLFQILFLSLQVEKMETQDFHLLI